MPTFSEIRQKYPQYSDLSDEQLARGLHDKFYSDMPFEEFSSQIGYSKAAPAEAPAPEAKTKPEPSLMEQVGMAIGYVPESDWEPGTFTKSLAHTVGSTIPNIVQGTRLALQGKEPTAAQAAESVKKEAEFRANRPKEVLEHEADVEAASKVADEAKRKAAVWGYGDNLPAGAYAANPALAREWAANREAGIKLRMKEVGVEDTPANREIVEKQDQAAYRSATSGHIAKKAEIFKNPEALKDFAGELLGGLAPVYAIAAAAGALTRSKYGADAVFFLTDAPQEVRARFMKHMTDELDKRGLEPTEKNFQKLYDEDNGKFLDEVKARSRLGGLTSSAAFTAGIGVAGNLANAAERGVAKKVQGEIAKSNASRETAAKLAAEGKGEEAAAELKKVLTPLQQSKLVQEAQAEVSTSKRVANQVASAATNIAAPAVGQVVGDMVAEGKIDTDEVLNKLAGQALFIIPEALHVNAAYRRGSKIAATSPEKTVLQDIGDLRSELNQATDNTHKENLADTLLGIHSEFYHSTGESPKDRSHLRTGYTESMGEVADAYRDILDKELAKPEGERDAERIKSLQEKLDYANTQLTYTSPHPAAPDVTVEEAVDFLRRAAEADKIEDTAKADEVRKQIQSDYESLVKERQNEREKATAGAGRTVGEAGEPAGGRAGEGAGERTQEGEAGAPGSEGVGTAGLGGAGADATRPNVGEEAARGPLVGHELDQANRLLNNRRIKPEDIFRLADRTGVKYDPQEDVADVFERVRNRVDALQDAASLEAGMSPGDILAKHGVRPAQSVEHAVADAVARGYKREWGIDITAVPNAEEMRRQSGRNVGDNVKGFYDPETGKVWINSELHPTEADVKSTIFHETLGHYGLGEKFRGELDGLLRDIYNKNEGIKKAVESWRKEKLSDTETNADTYSHLDDETQLARAVEEVLARESEKGRVMSSPFRQLIALVRKYLRKIPKIGERMSYSDNDVLHVLRDAHEYVTKGKGEFKVGSDGQLRYSWHGEKSRPVTEAERRSLETAKFMESRGKDVKSIYLTTGWLKNPVDGKWHREFSDARAQLSLDPKELATNHPIPLKDIFDHPELFQRYPQLQYARVMRTDTRGANGIAYRKDGNIPARIYYSEDIESPQSLKEVLVHEIQHLIQDEEGWATGGSMEGLPRILSMDDRKVLGQDIADLIKNSRLNEWGSGDKFRELTDKELVKDLMAGDRAALEALIHNYEDLPGTIRNELFDAYERLGGEIEARIATKRMDLNESQLRRRPVDFEREYRRGLLPVETKLPSTPAESVRYSKNKFDDLNKQAEERPQFNRTVFDSLLNRLSSVIDIESPLKAKYNAYGVIKLLDIEKLAQIYEGELPPVRTISDLTGQLSAEHQTKDIEIANTAHKWYETIQGLEKKKAGTAHEFSDVALKTTVWQIDPLAPKSMQIYQDVKSKKIPHPTEFDRMTHNLMQRWLDLDPEARKVYEEMRKYYDNALQRYLSNVAKYAGQNAANKLRQAYLDNNLQVYLPLTRHGEYWLKAVDKNGYEIRTSFDSPRERRKSAEWLAKKGYKDISEFERAKNTFRSGQTDNQLLSDVIESMKTNGASQQMLQTVYETFLDHANVGAMANMFRERKGIEGYAQDVLGSYATVARRMERAISGMEYGDKFRTAMENFKRDVVNNAGSGYTATELPTQYAILQDHLNNHINIVLNPPIPGALGRAVHGLTGINYYWTIAMSASTGLFNTMSNPAVSLPMLVGAHGSSAYEVYGKAQKMYMNGGFEIAVHDLIPDWTFMNKAKGEYKLLGDALLANGVISRANGADLQNLRNIKPGDFSRRMEGARRIAGFVMQNTERMNREVAALAAYMLKRKEGASINKSIDYAIRHVEAVHGPGSTLTTAPAFKTPVGALIYNLKRYPVNVLFQQGRLLLAATKGVDGITRELAAKQLGSMMIHSGLLLGGMGMPFMGAASLFLALLHSFGLLGDKDKPFDPENELHELTGFDLNGAIPSALGIDPSSMKLNDVLWRENPYDWQKSGALDYLLHQIGGVTYSVNANFIRGANQVWDGEYMQGAETIAPAFLKRVMKTYRYATQGAKTTAGIAMVDENQKKIRLGGYDYFIQALGFTPKEIAEFQQRHNSVMQADMFVKEKTAEYRRKMYKAIEEGDSEAVNEYGRRWVDVQINNGVFLNSKSIEGLVSGYKAKKKGEMFMVDGVRSNLNRYRFMREQSKKSDWD